MRVFQNPRAGRENHVVYREGIAHSLFEGKEGASRGDGTHEALIPKGSEGFQIRFRCPSIGSEECSVKIGDE